ncbi:hypothetical protein JOF29_002614 [Kribbella aluminosa]|uniref:tRNA nuclease CdiA C-terminal domain-containing protein n=1 Tax=Kribbella aluminosa TaxID=416017 RepID=A0ABS4UIN7_9ACTN|nr:hypothetical protein [Kribbella aluminosa]MBP2351531.1 hypothetical protein [Kribbella aluminosa]
MASELQRVARGLVDCFDEIPRVVDQLLRTAARCRENAQLALIASRGQATVAAQQLDAAAHSCEAAAHYLSMAPPKARGWAEGLIGAAGPSTNRPSSDSADRNKSTSGTGVRIRTTRLTATYDDLEVAEDNEPPLVTVSRTAFEKYRKTAEEDSHEPLEFEITVTETGEIIVEERDEKEEAEREERLTRDFELTPDRDDEDEPPEFEERDEKEDQKREDRLTADHELDVDLTEQVKTLLATMAESEGQEWQHATLTITTDKVEATFDYAEAPQFAPITVDIELPELATPDSFDFDPAFDPRPLEADFAPGVHDPENSFKPHERLIADRLAEEEWRVDARREDHSSGDKDPDATVRKHADRRGTVVEFKTPNQNGANILRRNICDASAQAAEVVIDGRNIDLSEADALRAYRRALGQPGKTIADIVHVILGDGRLVTYRREK